MKDKQQSYYVNIGSSSLLVIFLVLCLVTFAILSLSSARSDYSFSERLAAHKQTYYEASAKAEEAVDEIDRILCETAVDVDLIGQPDAGNSGEASERLQEYFARIGETLQEARIEDVSVQVRQSEEGCEISFRVPAGDRQALLVVLQVTDCREHENYYEVKAWKVVNTDNWESEQPLNLMPVIRE